MFKIFKIIFINVIIILFISKFGYTNECKIKICLLVPMSGEKNKLGQLIIKSTDFIKLTSKNSIKVIKNTNDKFIEGDEDLLNRVMINLIKNSEEALEDIKQKDPNFKGNIDIEIVSNNDYITFRIHDNGPGITDAKKAMTPYFTTKKTGTGLGLPIVTKIINEHLGDFSIRNKKKGKGTIISISLPKLNA